MNLLELKDLPKNHKYYRSSSNLYKKYLEKCKLKTIKLTNREFGWMKKILWLFYVAKFERVDSEPDIKLLKKNWFTHGIVIWVPYSRQEIPVWWKKLYLNSHFTTNWFSEINNEFYYKKWKERSKRARKKFLENKDLEIKLVDKDTFQEIYGETKISQPFKKSFMKYHKDISSLDDKNEIKNMVCFYKGKAIAWLAVINYNWNSSAHLVSFLSKEWKKLQAWTGLIDFWFKSSLENGIKYINFDHLRDKYMWRDQQWYTNFKENFIDYKVVFEKSYFKII